MLHPRFQNVTDFHSFKEAMVDLVIPGVILTERDSYRIWYILCKAQQRFDWSFSFADLFLERSNAREVVTKIKKILSFIGIVPQHIEPIQFYDLGQIDQNKIKFLFYDYDFSHIRNWEVGPRFESLFIREYERFFHEQTELIRNQALSLSRLYSGEITNYSQILEVPIQTNTTSIIQESQIVFHYDFDPFESIPEELFDILRTESINDVERFVVQERETEDLLARIQRIEEFMLDNSF